MSALREQGRKTPTLNYVFGVRGGGYERTKNDHWFPETPNLATVRLTYKKVSEGKFNVPFRRGFMEDNSR